MLCSQWRALEPVVGTSCSVGHLGTGKVDVYEVVDHDRHVYGIDRHQGGLLHHWLWCSIAAHSAKSVHWQQATACNNALAACSRSMMSSTSRCLRAASARHESPAELPSSSR